MKYKMVLIEGTEASRVRRYAYRGHVIEQTYRSHDVRNKTHTGFVWTIDGGKHVFASTRANAKKAIDSIVDRIPANPPVPVPTAIADLLKSFLQS